LIKNSDLKIRDLKIIIIFYWGLKMRAEGPRKFLNLDCAVSEMPFPGLWERFDRILMVRK
jgi:hypothetical protein